MSMLINVILLLFSVCISTLSFAQESNESNIFLQRLTVKDGLSQGNIFEVLQDKEGFLWFATENGVNIYDGYRFRVLPGPNGQFSDIGVYKILQDKDSLIWLITSHGLYTYNKLTDQYQQLLKHAPENKGYYFVDFVEGNENRLWVVSNKTLLSIDKTNSHHQTLIDFSTIFAEDERINEIQRNDQYLYIATRAGVYVVNSVNGQWKKLPSINQGKIIKNPKLDKIYNLHITNDGYLYAGSFDGLYKINVNNIASFLVGDSHLPAYELVDKNIASWTFNPTENGLYIGSQTGLSKLDFTTGLVKHQLAFNEVFDHINNNSITSIHIDKQGVFWLGSYGSGIYKWDPKLSRIRNLRYQKSNPNRLSDNIVWSIEKSHKNADLIWVATENGLNLVNVKTNEVERYLINLTDKEYNIVSNISFIQEDKENRLWLLTKKGIRLFDIKTKQLVDLPFNEEIKKYLSLDHYGIYLDEDDYLWNISDRQFRRINIKTGSIDELTEIESIARDNEIYNILGFLPNSQKMLLSTNKSLLSFDLQTREAKTLYTHEGVLESDWSYIDSWVIDKNNILWLAFSSKGLVGLDATTYQKKYFYNRTTSNIDHNIYGLLQDSDGDLWFSSHNGIYNINSKTQHIRNFNVDDGFSAREFNAGSFEKVNDSLFAYGSINGVSVFNPNELKSDNYEGELVVHAINVDVLSREIKLPFLLNPDERIELNYDDVGIRFDFSALTYQHTDLVYSYRLEGQRNVNYPETKDNFITFPSLPSGENTLAVRIKSPYSGAYSKETLLKIYVSYAPWNSPFAYFMYVMSVLTIVIIWLARKKKHTQALIDAHEQVKFREQRLSLALHGSNSAAWDWQAKGNLMFGCRAEQELGFKNLTDSYAFEQHIELIHENDREAFMHQWQTFIDNADLEDNFSCSYRLRNAKGEWLWYKDLGKIVEVDSDQKPLRITGSYTNITQSRAASERAQYYGDAFKKTQDWVLIISDNFKRVMVNESLQQVFGWHEDEFSFDSEIFGFNQQKIAFYQKLLLSLDENEHWRGEELIETKQGEEFHVLININVSKNETTNTLHYVCIFTDITAQKSAEKELRYLANYDHLTGLPNRSLLLERIKHGMDYSKRISQSIAIFFIDLDRFKQVNDSLGHDVGDLLLQEITTRLKSVLRVDDTVARLGGDEFVILLESYSSNPQLGKIAQKVIDIVGEPVELKENIVSVGASIGIALYPDDAENSDELLKNADVAMYHAKQLGRNTFQFFTPRMNVEATQRLHAESKIKQAFEEDQFINHYQPVVDSITGKAKGVELLLRWQSEDKLIMPGEFISIAEEIALIIPMTEKALHRGLADLQHWREYRKDMFLSVNLSAVHFSQDSLLPFLTETLKHYNLPASALKLEVTESTLIKEPEDVVQRMKALAKLGVTLALDDFGTGYSSLNYLKQLPLDILKIDRSFVRGIGIDSADEAIVDATLALANSLCMNCIAEGVETKEQLAYLAKRDCYAIQGYLYSKPVEAKTITQFLIDDNIELTI
ncbi:EAL domain-containing protein [Colwelliaceae bacterium 6441]